MIWANQQVAKYYGGGAPLKQLSDIPFEDVAANCFRNLHQRMLLSTRTEELYLSNYRIHILPLLKDRAIGSVGGRLLTECLDRIKFERPGRPLTRTVTIAKTVFQYIFDYAYQQHFRMDNPMLYVTLPQQTVSEKKQRYQEVDQRQITKELEAALLEASRDDSSELMRVAILLLLDSGLRIGEAVSVRWSNLSFADKLIATKTTLVAMRTEMLRLAKLLPEYDTVLAMYGVGEITAAQLMAEIGDVRRYPRRSSLVAFAGVDTAVNQSGKHEAHSNPTTKRGSPHLRKTLYQIVRTYLKSLQQTSRCTSSLARNAVRASPISCTRLPGLTSFCVPTTHG